MARQKLEASARTVRRWCLGVAAAQGVQAVAAAIWVVDPGQRAHVIGWSMLATLLTLVARHGLPDTTERRPKRPVQWTYSSQNMWDAVVTSAVPLFGASVARELVPARPSFWVESAVYFSAGLSTLLAVTLIRKGRRRHRNPGSSRTPSG